MRSARKRGSPWNAAKRRGSTDQRSIGMLPLTIHSPSARPAPPEYAIPPELKPAAMKYPRRPASSPSMQPARPHARTVHDDVAGDLAVARADAGDGAVTREDFVHRGLLHDARSARTGAGGERLRRVGRDHAAVVRNPDAAFEIVDAAEGPAATDLVAIHDVRLDPRVAAQRDGPAELRHARRAPGDAEAAHLLPVGAHAGLGLEPRVQVGAVADEPRHRARAAQTADEPGGVPRRAARELLALEQG